MIVKIQKQLIDFLIRENRREFSFHVYKQRNANYIS